MDYTTDVVIVGAGAAGLATAACLGRLGVRYEILEAGDAPAAEEPTAEAAPEDTTDTADQDAEAPEPATTTDDPAEGSDDTTSNNEESE